MKKSLNLLLCFLFLLSGCDSTKFQSLASVDPVLPSASVTNTVTPQITITPSMTVAPENVTTTLTLSVDEVTSTSQPALPDEHYITGVYGHKQYFPLGCEAGVAVDWASYFGVSINEFEFQTSLPLSDNPDLGFVGSVDGPWGQIPPYAYGVHAAPVAELLQTYDLDAQAKKNFTLQELKQQLAMDQPVIAWVIGNVVGGIPYEYVDSNGNTTIVAAYEHVIIVTGYNQEMIRFNNNGKVYEIPYDIFENSWSVLGNMVLIMGDNKTDLSQELPE